MPELTVSSAELQRAFGRYREAALKSPVKITAHGRESLVLMSAEEYRRLKSRDREALYPWELSARDIADLRAGEPAPESAAFNDEYRSA